MDLDCRTHNQRLDNLALNLLDHDDNNEHNQCHGGAFEDQSHQNSKSAGNRGTNKGHKTAEENCDRNGQHQRKAQEEGARSNADGVNEGNQNLHAHEADESDPPSLT